MGDREFGTVLLDQIVQILNPSLKRLFQPRGIEDDESNLPPVFTLIFAADDTDRFLKLLTLQPKLTVQRDVRQSGREPVGSNIQISQSRQELCSIPVRSHAIQLFADPPVGDVGNPVPAFCE